MSDKRVGSFYDAGRPMTGFDMNWIVEHSSDKPTETDIVEAQREAEVEATIEES